MKNVRLFAVAAAMGMFASTVAAAEPVTKDAYVATWGAVDEIIKVDVGDKVVLPTAEIKVVKETRTTDAEYASTTTEDSLGIESTTSVCYAGWTNTEGTDKNGDGIVDTKMLIAGIDLTDDNAEWLYTNSKFWPSAKTATYYVGLGGGSVTGGIFLAPGAAKNDIYTLALAHKNIGDEDAVIAYLEEQGLVEIVEDEDGYIDYVTVNPITVKTAKGKEVGTASIRITALDHKYADDEVKSAIVKMFLEGSDNVGDTEYYTVEPVYTYTYDEETTLGYYVGKTLITEDEIEAGYILKVFENKYGDLEISTSTATDLKMANGKPLEAVPGRIVVALDNEDKAGSWTKYMTIKPATAAAYTPTAKMFWNDEAGNFVKVVDKATTFEDDDLNGIFWNSTVDAEGKKEATDMKVADLDVPEHALGLYHVVTPANPSDKIVIYTDAVNVTGLNTKNNTMTVAYGDGKELKVSAVKIDGAWYPAVNTEEEVVKFVEKVLDLRTYEGDTTKDDDKNDATDKKADSEFDAWVDQLQFEAKNPLTGVSLPSRTNAEGEKETYVPENSLQHYKAQFCTYKVADGDAVTATVTGNVDAIDTTSAGVKTLTLTAKVGEEVVGTKEIKVVVAPKYERVYKNGKVVKLTAKWLNGNTYAVYNYDWAAKTYTATFYAQDGVTVAATSNGTL